MVVLGAALAVTTLLALVLVGLALSEGGTRFMAAQAERLLPVRFEGVAGTLWRRLAVDRVTVVLERQQLVIEALRIEQDLFPLLFDNRLELHSVRAGTVTLVTGAPAGPDDPQTRLTLPFLPVDIRLDDLRIETLILAAAPPLAITGAATWSDAGLDVQRLTVEGEGLQATLRGRLAGTLRPELEARVDWSLPQAGWAGQADLAGQVYHLQVTLSVQGPYPFDVAGVVDVSVPAHPVLDLDVSVHDIAAGQWAVSATSVRLAGTLDELAVDAAAQVDPRRFAPFPVRLALRGPVAGPVAVEASGEPLAGEVRASGRVDWSDGLALTLGGEAKGLDATPLLAGHSGSLSAKFAVDVAEQAVTVELADIGGVIDEASVTGGARVRAAEGAWAVEGATLAVGDNRADFSGRWADDAVTLAGRVEAPALEQLGLAFGGSAAAEFDVAGDWPELDGSLTVRAERLVTGAFEVEALNGSARLARGALNGELAAARLGAAAAALADVRFAVSGAVDALDWRLAWAGGESRGRFVQRDGAQLLDVAALRVTLADAAYAIESPIVARLANGSIEVAPVCVAGGDARVCLARLETKTGGRLTSAGRIERVPVALLQAHLPAAERVQGFVEGEWNVNGAGSDWAGDFSLAGRQLELDVAGDEQDRFELPDVELSGTLAGAGLDVVVRARGEALELEGRGRLVPLAVDGQLTGSVEAAVASLGELAWLPEFDGRLREVGGAVTARLAVAGAANAPIVTGTLELRDGVVGVQDPEFRLEAIALDARLAADGGFEFSGSAIQRKGDERGEVALAGQGSGLYGGGALLLDATLHGANLRATHPQFEVAVAPDLALSLRDGVMRVTGTVELPRADVRLRTLPASVPRPSPDVVVVGRELPAASDVPGRVRMNVRVLVGREVKLSALGAQANLTGELRVRRDARGQTSARGTLDVSGGVIAAQGQVLTIESGTVIYNGPIANPYLDVRAVRQIEGQKPPVKVGLHIRGDARRLTSTIFSEPPMAENRALGFLVLGRDIEQGQSEDDSGALLAAAINLGLGQSRSLIGQLQRAAGLDELSAVAEGQDGFSLAAGKRISESVYLRYLYNTLTAVGAILISFELTERWRVEAVSGEESAMDVLYRIDR